MKPNFNKINFDSSTIKNIRFKCTMCGVCCFREFVVVHTDEIKKMMNYLEECPEKDIRNFAKDCYINSGSKEDFESYFKKMKNTMFHFFIPNQQVPCEECNLVYNHFILSMRTSGRCIFFDPIKKVCFIYSARPTICRTYPFTSRSIDAENWIFDFDNCEGIGKSGKIDLKELENIFREDFKFIDKDIEIFKKFIEDKKLTPLKREGNKSEMTDEQIEEMINEQRLIWFDHGKPKETIETNQKAQKKLIDPFVELGIIPVSAFEFAKQKIKNGT